MADTLELTTQTHAEVDAPPTSLGTRLWFGWFCFVATVWAVPMTCALVIDSLFERNAKKFKRWSGLWADVVLALAGVRVRVCEKEPLDSEQPYVFAVNHQNMLDIFILAGKLPHPFGFVAKEEVRRMPVIGIAMRHAPSVFVDRSNPRAAVASMKIAGQQIREGNSVLIFPEGHRAYAPTLLPLKKGAFMLALEAGVPIVPVTIVDSYRLMDERAFIARPGTITLIVGHPISLEGRRRKDIPNIMAEVQAQLEADLNC